MAACLSRATDDGGRAGRRPDAPTPADSQPVRSTPSTAARRAGTPASPLGRLRARSMLSPSRERADPGQSGAGATLPTCLGETHLTGWADRYRSCVARSSDLSRRVVSRRGCGACRSCGAARDQSISSARCSFASSTSCRRSHTPACCHSCNRRQQVMPAPHLLMQMRPRNPGLQHEQDVRQPLAVRNPLAPGMFETTRHHRDQRLDDHPELVADQRSGHVPRLNRGHTYNSTQAYITLSVRSSQLSPIGSRPTRSWVVRRTASGYLRWRSIRSTTLPYLRP
jgi:hypothetical protein